jgi:hypothetical protein
MSNNTGHGHVTPRPDGVRARCGGPAMCRVCQMERARLELSAEPAAEPTVLVVHPEDPLLKHLPDGTHVVLQRKLTSTK